MLLAPQVAVAVHAFAMNCMKYKANSTLNAGIQTFFGIGNDFLHSVASKPLIIL